MPPKTILITGCGQKSIGSALARHFRLLGHTVFATGRTTTPKSLDPALADLGCHTLQLDVTSPESIASAKEAVSRQTGGKLDILINNAGRLHGLPFADTPLDEVREVFEVNFFGVWAVTHAFLPLLIESGGIMAYLGSVGQVFCTAFTASYSASKSAVEGMGRVLRRELAPLGVRVVNLKTGTVQTGLFEKNTPVLPEGSLYGGAREIIEERPWTKAKSMGFQEVDPWAEGVVKELLKENVKAVIWSGGMSTVAWIMSWFGWETMLVSGYLPTYLLVLVVT